MHEVQVLKTTLSIYMEDQTLPLPTCEEVLVCSESTSDDEASTVLRVIIHVCEYYDINVRK